MTDRNGTDDRAARIERIHDHLLACTDEPLDEAASERIDEAEAAVQALLDGDPSDVEVAMQLGQVMERLRIVRDRVDGTAAEHVERAMELTTEVLDGPGQ